MAQIHQSAAIGYDQASDIYASARPSYHAAVLDLIATAIADAARDSSGTEHTVLDLGAGTGISTSALLERGLDVVAVEPVPAMRTTFERRVPGATVIEGTAQSIPLSDGSAVAVVAAQSFHWFDHAPALDEIARVLEPGGLLVTLWNVRDESVPWMAAYTDIQDVAQGETPRYRTMLWRTAIEHDARFELVDEVRQSNPQPSNADRTVARFLSTSFIAELAPNHQAELEIQIRELVAGLGDSYDFPYVTEAQLWQLSPTQAYGSARSD